MKKKVDLISEDWNKRSVVEIECNGGFQLWQRQRRVWGVGAKL